MIIPMEGMSDDNYKLFQLHKKEGEFDFIAAHTKGDLVIGMLDLEVSENLYSLAMQYMKIENLFKHYRDNVVVERYECLPRIKEEIERRGYVITHLDKSINFKLKDELSTT